MVAVSIMIEGQQGLTWPRWQRICATVEESGFAGLFRSDHFTNGAPPDQDALEPIVSLVYLAGNTTRVHFGPLVAPVSFRDPVMLARQAIAIDDLSGGRMFLGLGAGWQEREHMNFGYNLGDVPTRFARFADALQVITRLLRDEGPVDFSSRFYHLNEAQLLPRPQRAGGPPILVGGSGPRRTLPLVAQYADVWNSSGLKPDEFQARSAQLDELVRAAGRRPGDVRRTMMRPVFFGRTLAEASERLRGRRLRPDLAGQPLERAAETLYREEAMLIGTPEMLAEQIARYGQAGVEELMLQWFDLDDLEGMRAFGAVARQS